MKYFKAVFVLLVLPSLAPAQGHSDLVAYERATFKEKSTRAGRTAYPGDDRFDVTYYKLDLNIDHDLKYLAASVFVIAKANTDIQSFFLDLANSLTVDSVLSNGTKLAFEHRDEKLIINLPREYNITELFSVEVFYQGYPDTEGDGGLDFRVHGDNLPSIYSLSPPYFAAEWWPCKDTPADKEDNKGIVAIGAD